MEESSKNLINGASNNNENIDMQSKRDFSLSNINFERIYKNLDKIRKERKGEPNIDKFDTKNIILDLKYQMRKDFYQLIDASDKKKIKNHINNLDDKNILGKKRKSDIPIIDITHTSLKKE